ncbi:hypothetical protein [Nostocoides veronense]|uniref:Acetyltransferase n=1 Tax=Nostocoides veronense TaxID=330836 RepID=A0ABN2LHJ7_9MICO
MRLVHDLLATESRHARIILGAHKRTLGKNSIQLGRRNRLESEFARLSGTRISVKGSNNLISIGPRTRIEGCHIFISGSNNTVTIGGDATLKDAELWIEDEGNCISVGQRTKITGRTHLAAIEGTALQIGEDCLFSSSIHFTTSDSHSIVDLAGSRVNPPESITVGDHVWIGTGVLALKGTQIASNCVIGAGSLLSGHYTTENAVFAGRPARLVRSKIDWHFERIPWAVDVT